MPANAMTRLHPHVNCARAMRFPVTASTTPFRAWLGGFALAAVVVSLPYWSLFVRVPMPFAATFYLIPVGIAAVALYSLTVRPRAFAASGALLGVAPFFAAGVIDGLQNCAKFNRSPGGGCEADPTAQVVIVVLVYAAALVATAVAARVASRAD